MIRIWATFAALWTLLLSCAATFPAGVRRIAEADLRYCLRGADATESARCYENEHAFCRMKRLEKTCGEGW